MVLIALLLLVVVAAVVAFLVVTGSTHAVSLDWHRLGVDLHAVPLLIFLAGAATLLVAELGVWMITGSSRRRLARRRELKHLRRSERRRATNTEKAQRVRGGTTAPVVGSERGADRSTTGATETSRAGERPDGDTGRVTTRH